MGGLGAESGIFMDPQAGVNFRVAEVEAEAEEVEAVLFCGSGSESVNNKPLPIKK